MASSVHGHVCAFGHELASVLDEIRRIFSGDLILRGAGEGAVRLDVPQRIVVQLDVGGHEDRLLELIAVFADAATANVLEFHDPSQLFAIDAIGIVNDAVGIGEA